MADPFGIGEKGKGGASDGLGLFGQGGFSGDPFTMLLQQAQATSAAALKAQQDANLIAAAANVPTIDSESARAAGDTQRRKLLSGSSFGIGMPAQLGAPPVGFRLLSGE